MIKLFIKLNDADSSFKIAAKRGRSVLKTAEGKYQRDLADKIIRALDKILAYVNIGKREKIRAYYDSSSNSFVSNLIANSVVSVFDWLRKN